METVVTPLPSPDMGYEQGVVFVKFTDDMISLVEEDLSKGSLATKSDGLNFTLESLGIQHMERVFPHAGEFEGRTRREGLHKWYKVTLAEDMPVTKASVALEDFDGFEYVEPVRKIKTGAFNDLDRGLWGLNNTSTMGADINVLRAWEQYSVGNPNVIVSVVDTGIDLSHEDLAANCLTMHHVNTNNPANAIEPQSHGTHVAGTIAAVSNNGKGVAGIAGGNAQAGQSGVKIMSCQIFGSGSGGNTSMAIKWGADHGAVISQNSWGYSYDFNDDGRITGSELDYAMNAKIDRVLKEAVDYFIKYAGCDDNGDQQPGSPMKGGVVIFAAGNDAIENGCPANYEPIIAVGAISQSGRRASFSNYGDWVDIAAPGQNILSTLPKNKYGNLSGTSMACPHVSGVAALVVSYCGGPGFTNEDLKEKLLMSTNYLVTPPSDKIGGLVNAYEAIRYNETGKPGDVADLEVSSLSNTINLSCTVTEDMDGQPNAGYLVVYGTKKSDVEWAHPTNTGAALSGYFQNDKAAGEVFEMKLDKLQFETEYYIKVYSKSLAGKYSFSTEVQSVSTMSNTPPEISVTVSADAFGATPNVLDVKVTDIDGHEVALRLESETQTESLVKVEDGLWKLKLPYRKDGESTVTLIASDECGLETTKTIRYNKVTP